MMNSVPAGRRRDDRRGVRRERAARRGRRASLPGSLGSVSAERTGGLVEIVDTTTRDGNQSLWGATGLTTRDVLAIAPTMDRVGFHAVDFTSSTHMAVAVRFHHEDPWERLRLVSAAMPNTPLSTHHHRHAVHLLAARRRGRACGSCSAARSATGSAGCRSPTRPTIPASLRRMAAIAREEGVEEIVIGLTYSVSPVHTDAYYAERAAAMADCADVDRLYLKDPGGLVTVDAVRELAPHFLRAAGERRSSSTATARSGSPRSSTWRGRAARLPASCTRRSRRWRNGTSNPAAETTLRNLAATGSPTGSTPRLSRRSPRTSGTCAREGAAARARPQDYDAAYYHHQMPGRHGDDDAPQLEELRRPELFDAALEETGRVREEFGWPIIVTPFSQFVGTQAVMNVMGEERWANVPDETYPLLPRRTSGSRRRRRTRRRRARALAAARAELRDLEPLRLEARERVPPADLGRGAAAAADDAAEQVDAIGAPEPVRAVPGGCRSPRVPSAIRWRGCWTRLRDDRRSRICGSRPTTNSSSGVVRTERLARRTRARRSSRRATPRPRASRDVPELRELERGGRSRRRPRGGAASCVIHQEKCSARQTRRRQVSDTRRAPRVAGLVPAASASASTRTSAIARLRPFAPVGGTMCAASPARKRRP